MEFSIEFVLKLFENFILYRVYTLKLNQTFNVAHDIGNSDNKHVNHLRSCGNASFLPINVKHKNKTFHSTPRSTFPITLRHCLLLLYVYINM